MYEFVMSRDHISRYEGDAEKQTGFKLTYEDGEKLFGHNWQVLLEEMDKYGTAIIAGMPKLRWEVVEICPECEYERTYDLLEWLKPQPRFANIRKLRSYCAKEGRDVWMKYTGWRQCIVAEVD